MPSRKAKPASVAVVSSSPETQQIAPRRTRPFPQPCHWRYFDAIAEALATDGLVSNRAIAKRMGIRHETITRWTRRNPEFRAWVSAQVQEATRGRHDYLIGRCFALGLRGSHDHAKLYFSVTGAPMGESQGSAGGGNHVQIINIAVPNQGDPPVSCSPHTIDMVKA